MDLKTLNHYSFLKANFDNEKTLFEAARYFQKNSFLGFNALIKVGIVSRING